MNGCKDLLSSVLLDSSSTGEVYQIITRMVGVSHPSGYVNVDSDK